MKNKKIVLALSLVIALGATLMVGGSLAWFTDTDEATNTFTVGSVEIVQKETGKDGTTPFEQDQQLIPVGDNDTPADDENFIHKQVTVENTGDNPAYVQTFIAVPKALDNGLLHWDVNLTADGWQQVGNGAVGTMNYDLDGNDQTPADVLTMNVYKYRYATALAKKDETGDKSSVLLNGVYIDEAADLNVYRDEQTDAITKAYFVWNGDEIEGYDVSKIEKLPILVATQAVQSQGFEADTVNNKTAAQVALDSAFPTHPWA